MAGSTLEKDCLSNGSTGPETSRLTATSKTLSI